MTEQDKVTQLVFRGNMPEFLSKLATSLQQQLPKARTVVVIVSGEKGALGLGFGTSSDEQSSARAEVVEALTKAAFAMACDCDEEVAG